jgi:uncharacterized membrane protein YsdA (DUF1294 family)
MPLSTPVLAIAFTYAAMSLITAGAYGIDKMRARRGGWRVPERTLHGLELAFGWPGGLVAQQVFRHKRRKARFFLVTWLIAVAHVGALALVWWLTR